MERSASTERSRRSEGQVAAPCGYLTCTLLDRRTSAPLANAHITCVAGSRIAQLETDARGQFRSDFPEGVYDILISARGELSLMLRGIGVLANHEQYITRALVPGDAADNVAAASAIGGFVHDRLDHAVAGLAVTARNALEGHAFTAHTDRFGAYVLHGVPPGDYDLTFRTSTETLHKERLRITAAKQFHRRDWRAV
jgi:hypothetical protein